ncbi:MAG: hypothetical protein GX306_04460 [Clostridiales bacterium]|nr:hypothetical protein [Clostridiales bacterium]
MEEQEILQQYQEEEVSLKELVMALWRQKKIIISIALIFAILTGIVSVFVLTPVYHTNLNIVINMPEVYHTKYGDYALPITTNDQYINLITSNDISIHTMKDIGYDAEEVTLEDLRERITVETNTTKSGVEQNTFKVKVAANNPVEAKQLADVLFENYVEFIDVLTAQGALNFYYNKFTVALTSLEDSLESTQKILSKNEELLAQTPQTINQKAAMDELHGQGNVNEFIVLENVINPNYTAIETDIVGNKQSINSIENSMRVYNEYLEELDLLKEKIDDYYETEDFDALENSIVSASKTNIYLPSQPIEPSRKTSPRNAMNVAIGTVLGGMLGVFIALIKEYWFNENN